MAESRIEPSVLDLLVVGAGPTGIAIGAEASRAGLDFLLVDRGPLLANLLEFPTFMRFFTTRDLLEVGGIPFSAPDDKPDSAHKMMIRVIDGAYVGPRASDEIPGLRLFDRLRFFTARLAHYGLQATPILGNGRELISFA